MFRLLLIYCLVFGISASASILQKAIDAAPIGATLKLPKGVFRGNIVITKPLTLLGIADGTVIEGEESKNVVEIRSINVTLRNITIKKSGKRIDTLDAGVFVHNAKGVRIENCTIKESLFGIFMDTVSDSVILNNNISSNNEAVGLRGDGLRLWMSHNNEIKNNTFIKVRDIVLMRSNDNTISNNEMQASRYAIYAQHSKNININNNKVIDSAVGIFLQGSFDSNITDNVIAGHHGAPTSMGILLMGASNVHVEKNSIGQCNRAVYIDNSPMKVGTKNWIFDNKILYSTRGLNFRGNSLRNVVTRNELRANMDNIMTDNYKGRSNENDIVGNFWDDYEGFDFNKDNVGDNSYKKYLYLDQLWVSNPKLQFFYGAPVLTMLNFLLKLAPFMEPIFLIEDKKPIIKMR